MPTEGRDSAGRVLGQPDSMASGGAVLSGTSAMVGTTYGAKAGVYPRPPLRLGRTAMQGDVAVRITADEITRIAHYADRLGVRLKVQVGESAIDLDWIGRRAFAPVGAGAAVMQALCDFADDTTRPIRLNVLHGRDRLIAFYHRFGFSILRAAEDDTDSTEMQRVPVPENSAAVSAISATGFLSVEARLQAHSLGMPAGLTTK